MTMFSFVKKHSMDRPLALFICAIVVAFFTPMPTSALAADVDAAEIFETNGYISTWDEYVEDADAVDPDFSTTFTWNDVTDAIDQVIESARADYEAGDTSAANTKINDGYYGYYDTMGFESETQARIGGSYVDAMELQFSKTRTAARTGTSEEFNTECDTLEEMLRDNANQLDPEGSTTSSTHENIATQVFEDNGYISTWDEYVVDADAIDPDFSTTFTWNDVTDAIDEVIESARADYEAGDTSAANTKINDGYYGYYDTMGFESETQARIGGSYVDAMELQFSKARTAARSGTADEFNSECDTLEEMLRDNANQLDPQDESASSEATETSAGSAVVSFFASFIIILREGIEAILVIGAIIAYLKKIQSANLEPKRAKRSLRAVYIGAILGIVCSFIMAAILNVLLLASSMSQEFIEGVVALIAVVVLYWVSNWMVSKSESEAWSSYIKKKAGSAVSGGSMFALVFVAWLSVFREGAEVILFYQALGAGSYSQFWIVVGFLVGCVALVVVYLVIYFIAVKLPLKPFFLATSILMFVMSIAFLGSGLKELIEADVIMGWYPDWCLGIPNNDVLAVLGIYPCGTTVVAQVLLLIVTICVWIFWMRRNKSLREEVAAQAAAETAVVESATDEAATAKSEESNEGTIDVDGTDDTAAQIDVDGTDDTAAQEDDSDKDAAPSDTTGAA